VKLQVHLNVFKGYSGLCGIFPQKLLWCLTLRKKIVSSNIT